MPLTRLFWRLSWISLATAQGISLAPPFVASFKVIVGSYFAWIGQMGMQLVLPAHARRFRYGSEFRAAGRLRTLSEVTDFPVSRNVVSTSDKSESAWPTS